MKYIIEIVPGYDEHAAPLPYYLAPLPIVHRFSSKRHDILEDMRWVEADSSMDLDDSFDRLEFTEISDVVLWLMDNDHDTDYLELL